MFIPIRTDYRMRHTPWVNYAIIVVNVLLFIMGVNGAGDAASTRVNELLLHPDNPRVVQFFTCIFLHAGWVHLIGNMVFLWVFGNAMNDRLGHVGYAAFYLAGGVIAGVGYALVSPGAPVLGASGAIAGVVGAYLVLFPRTRVTVITWLFYVIWPFEISSLFFIGFQVVFNLTMAYADSEGGGGVAYSAHISGYAFGIAVAAALLAARILPRDAFDLLNLIRARHRRQQYRKMVSQGYDPFGYARPAGATPGAPQYIGARVVSTAEPETPQAIEQRLRRQIADAIERRDIGTAASRYMALLQVAEDVVLPQQQQLDVANQLMSAEQYPQAADAYERFLRHYADYEHLADIDLMLGLIYSRYLHQYGRAAELLEQAAAKLQDPRKVQLATGDLEAIRRLR